MRPRGFARRMFTFMQKTTQSKATAATIVCLVALGGAYGKAVSSATDARAADATLRLVIPERPVGQDPPAETVRSTPAGFAVVPNAPARLTADSPLQAIENWNEPRTEIALRCSANPLRTMPNMAAETRGSARGTASYNVLRPENTEAGTQTPSDGVGEIRLCSTEGWVGRYAPAEASRIPTTPNAQMTIRSSAHPEPIAERSGVGRPAAPDQGWVPRGMGPERRELVAACLRAPVASSPTSPEPRRSEEQAEPEAKADRHRNQLAALALSAPTARTAKRPVDRWAAYEEVLAESFPESDVRLVAAADEVFVQGYARDARRAAGILAVVRDYAAEDEAVGRFVGSVQVVNMLQIPEVRPVEVPVGNPIDVPIKIVGPFGHGK